MGTFGIPFGGFLVRVVDGIDNDEIILWPSVSWSAAADPSSSPFLHLLAADASLASSMHSGGVSRCSLLRQIHGLAPIVSLEGGSWLTFLVDEVQATTTRTFWCFGCCV